MIAAMVIHTHANSSVLLLTLYDTIAVTSASVTIAMVSNLQIQTIPNAADQPSGCILFSILHL